MNEEQINRLGSIHFSTKTNGIGLGLTFSYKVIRALGGEVSVTSQPGAGTLFTLTIPEIKAGDEAKAERKS
jgi:two-component system sporulation sensor kinase B